MDNPIIVLNFKTYAEGTGANAVRIAGDVEDAVRGLGAQMILAVQPTDISAVAACTGLKVFSQHIDPVGHGAHTGSITPFAVRDAGGSGALINHSEKRVGIDAAISSIKLCKEAGISSIVCVESAVEAAAIAPANPDFIAVEDRGLIGSGKSILTHNPKVVEDAVDAVKGTGICLLCGAGISNKNDLRAALEMGLEGVILSSAIIKSESPRMALERLLK